MRSPCGRFVSMTSSTATLLRQLLTRADLAQITGDAAQIDTWLHDGALARVGEVPGDGGAEPVFTVTDTKLRAELAQKLAASGKDDVALSVEQLHDVLAREVAATATESDPSRQLAMAVAALGADFDVVLDLADAPTPLDAAPAAAPTPAAGPMSEDEAVVEALIAPVPTSARSRPKTDTEWFDVSELEAAMGDLLPMTASVAAEAPATAFEVTPAAPPHANVTEDLYALTEMVHGHGQRLEALEAAIADLTRMQPPEAAPAELPADDAADATTSEPRHTDQRRTAGLVFACALSGWSLLLWFGTGSATLALASLCAAAAIVGAALRTR